MKTDAIHAQVTGNMKEEARLKGIIQELEEAYIRKWPNSGGSTGRDVKTRTQTLAGQVDEAEDAPRNHTAESLMTQLKPWSLAADHAT